jgi:hypothetical protein
MLVSTVKVGCLAADVFLSLLSLVVDLIPASWTKFYSGFLKLFTMSWLVTLSAGDWNMFLLGVGLAVGVTPERLKIFGDLGDLKDISCGAILAAVFLLLIRI